MTDTSDAAGHAADALARFHAGNGPNGLFLRYCRGRLRRTLPRLLFCWFGAAVFALLHDAATGLLIAVIVAAGEAVEVLTIRLVLDRWTADRPAPRPVRIAVAAVGLVQALFMAAAACLLWVRGVDGETQSLTVVYLAAAALDAGVPLRFHACSARVRMLVYATTAAGLTGWELARHDLAEAVTGRHGFDLAATLLLACVVGLVIRFVVRSHDRRTRDALTILEDQAELVSAQIALARQERAARRLALVARHANDGVIIYRADGTIDWVNETFSRVTGYTPDELVGRRIEDAIPSVDLDPEGTQALVAARRDRRAYRGELRTRNRAGGEIWLEANLTPIPPGEGIDAAMIAVERDITEAKTREAELARARAEAEDAAQAKARFLATMSHEIRTPMNGVIGTAELLAETRLDADQRLYVETIVTSGRALLDIINDVLDLSRLQSGRPVLAPAPVDLADCIARAAVLLRPTAQAKGIALDVDAAPLPLLMADGGRVRQIALNLIGNAIKFTAEGGVAVRLAATGTGAVRQFTLSVADSGIGIPADRIAAVFDSFTQAGDDVGRRFGGTGLGLTISRRLAEEMGGTLTACSDEGRGSVFTLAVALAVAEAGQEGQRGPAADVAGSRAAPGTDDLGSAHAAAPPGQVSPPAEPGSAETAPRQPERPATTDAPRTTTAYGGDWAARTDAGPGEPVQLLLAEDNRTNALIAVRMLAGAGFAIRHVPDGQAAYRAFAEQRPAIVLTDLAMPGLSGFELLAAIRAEEARADRPPCVAIALTASGFETDRHACLAAGFDGFVTKPVRKQALLDEIARCRAIAAAQRDGTPAQAPPERAPSPARASRQGPAEPEPDPAPYAPAPVPIRVTAGREPPPDSACDRTRLPPPVRRARPAAPLEEPDAPLPPQPPPRSAALPSQPAPDFPPDPARPSGPGDPAGLPRTAPPATTRRPAPPPTRRRAL